MLDPNSDYVRLGDPRPGAEPSPVERYRTAAGSVAVRSGTSGGDRIRIRLRDLSPEHQAALLRLDPVADRSEYAELLVAGGGRERRQPGGPGQLQCGGAEAARPQPRRGPLGHLGGVEGASLPAELESDDAARCIVVDLGSLPTREEQAVTAGAVLERLLEAARATRARRDRDR